MKILTLDLNFQGRPKAIASYLIEAPAGFILIETGPASTIPVLLKKLGEKGLSPSNLKAIFVTHIHLDHAGAAGWLAQQGPKVYVHDVGAPHLVDPSRLLKSASRIYGDSMDSLWGRPLPAPAEQVISLYDGDEINVAGLTVTALDSPGHAYHHHVFSIGNVAFTGDAAGVRIEGKKLITLPAPPPEFNPEAWEKTINLIEEKRFMTLYPTHYGPLDDPDHQLGTLLGILKETSTRVRQLLEEGADREAISEEYLIWQRDRAKAAGLSSAEIATYEVANPYSMSVDGIIRYWNKQGITDKLAQSNDKASSD